MKTRQRASNPGWGGTCAAGLVLTTVCAWGGILTPLYMGNLAPILDQNGQPMAGSNEADPATRARVEIRTTPDGIIRPPSTNGVAHPFNPLLSSNSVGGVGLNSSAPGLFAMVFPVRPATGTKIFARAYNAPTVAEASFYADAAVVSAPERDLSLVLTFGAAQPLDPGDADGDGLINSWEKALGIDDRLTGDYDGDGMSDLSEMMSGTAPNDANSLLAFRSICGEELADSPVAVRGASARPLRLNFLSTPGKKYQIEHASTLLGEPVFLPVGEVVTAGAGEYELEISVDVPAFRAGVFRVKLVSQ